MQSSKVAGQCSAWSIVVRQELRERHLTIAYSQAELVERLLRNDRERDAHAKVTRCRRHPPLLLATHKARPCGCGAGASAVSAGSSAAGSANSSGGSPVAARAPDFSAAETLRKFAPFPHFGRSGQSFHAATCKPASATDDGPSRSAPLWTIDPSTADPFDDNGIFTVAFNDEPFLHWQFWVFAARG